MAAAAAAPAQAPAEVPEGELSSFLSTRFSPRKLPARARAPVRLALTQRIWTRAGTHPPPLQELELDLDRHLGLSVKGVPRCGPLLHESPTREDTISQCEDAKVGSGTIEAEVAFPEQQPVQVRGRVSVYNRGVRHGRTGFLLYAYFPAPVTGAFVVPLEVGRRVQGPFGWNAVLSFPKIANGAGSITNLRFRVRRGIFSASCPTGKLRTHAISRFADGEALAISSTSVCSTRAG